MAYFNTSCLLTAYKNYSRNIYKSNLINKFVERCPFLTGVSHLPEDIRLQDLGHVAGDGPQQASAGVASSGVPESRAQREAGSPEGAG